MRTIAYLSQVLVTEDAVADLVIQYARALAVADTSDAVRIPTLDVDGNVALVDLLLGPASQMMSSESSAPETDLEAEPVLAELRQRIARLAPRANPEAQSWIDPVIE